MDRGLVPTTVAEGIRTYGHQVAAGSDGTVAAVWELRDGADDRIQSAVLVPFCGQPLCRNNGAGRSGCRQ